MNRFLRAVGCIALVSVVAMNSPAAEKAKPNAKAGDKHTLHSFKKLQLTDKFFSEGASFGDFNHDGVMDIVSGPAATSSWVDMAVLLHVEVSVSPNGSPATVPLS